MCGKTLRIARLTSKCRPLANTNEPHQLLIAAVANSTAPPSVDSRDKIIDDGCTNFYVIHSKVTVY